MEYSREDIIAHIGSEYGYRVSHIVPFKSGRVNSSFYIETAENGLFVFRVYEQKTMGDIQCEIAILEVLASQSFPCQRVMQLRSQSLASLFQGKPSVLVSFIPGSPARELIIPQLYALGGLLARLHETPIDHVLCRKHTWDPENLAKIFVTEKDTFVKDGVHGAVAVATFFERHQYRFVFPKLLPVGITHQDMKKENIIVMEDTILGIIDFDNAYVGTLLHDIATTLMWTCYFGDHLVRERCQAFLDGYQGVRTLTRMEKEYLVAALQHRLVREAFIGPYAAVKNKEDAFKTSEHFMQLFEHFGITDERVLLSSAGV